MKILGCSRCTLLTWLAVLVGLLYMLQPAWGQTADTPAATRPAPGKRKPLPRTQPGAGAPAKAQPPGPAKTPGETPVPGQRRLPPLPADVVPGQGSSRDAKPAG